MKFTLIQITLVLCFPITIQAAGLGDVMLDHTTGIKNSGEVISKVIPFFKKSNIHSVTDGTTKRKFTDNDVKKFLTYLSENGFENVNKQAKTLDIWGKRFESYDDRGIFYRKELMKNILTHLHNTLFTVSKEKSRIPSSTDQNKLCEVYKIFERDFLTNEVNIAHIDNNMGYFGYYSLVKFKLQNVLDAPTVCESVSGSKANKESLASPTRDGRAEPKAID